MSPMTRPVVSPPDRLERERRRRGQKVARGKREARSPWIANKKKFRPEGPTETNGARVCRPFGLARFLRMIQRRRARYASHWPLATFCRACGAGDGPARQNLSELQLKTLEAKHTTNREFWISVLLTRRVCDRGGSRLSRELCL
jgi:hypothetical protein